MLDFSKYKPSSKVLPILLLLDGSGSMKGDKIIALNNAVNEMISCFCSMNTREISAKIAVIVFGVPDTKIKLWLDFTDVSELAKNPMPPVVADRGTFMGAALKMAKEMIDDKTHTPANWYRPAVVLVSDGRPTDSWKGIMKEFVENGRTAVCHRISMAIGDDVKLEALEKFASSKEDIYYANDASAIVNNFKTISTSIKNTVSKHADVDNRRTNVISDDQPIRSRLRPNTVKRASVVFDEEEF